MLDRRAVRHTARLREKKRPDGGWQTRRGFRQSPAWWEPE